MTPLRTCGDARRVRARPARRCSTSSTRSHRSRTWSTRPRRPRPSSRPCSPPRAVPTRGDPPGAAPSAVAGALVLALSGVGATGLSAAANTLPRPLQHQVSQFSHHYLPFDLPEPPGRP